MSASTIPSACAPARPPALRSTSGAASRARYGAQMPVDWRERLVCSKCGSRQIDMVVTGTERRS
jgi:hypothetical protein